jgi:hypothetical protein
LAGISVAYHLLLSLLSSSSSQQQQQAPHTEPKNSVSYDITIYDTANEIGTGGASAIAGGYVRGPLLFLLLLSLLLLLMFVH